MFSRDEDNCALHEHLRTNETLTVEQIIRYFFVVTLVLHKIICCGYL